MVLKASGLRELLFIFMFAVSVHSRPARISFPLSKKTNAEMVELVRKPMLRMTHVSALTPQTMDESEAIDYLKRVGYMDEGTQVGGGPAAMHSFSESLKKLQRFTGLEETGVLDEETIKVMKSPRCGLKDNDQSDERFAAIEKWSKNDLTYVIQNYPTNSYNLNNRELVDAIIKRAFKDWSDVANLKFTRKTGSPSDIEVGFYSRDHNDNNNFDGQGFTLAHAFYPEDGRLHGDNDEKWSSNHFGGPNLRQVMTHEVGHIIGLGHTAVRGAVMYPYYSYRPNFKLAADDINGARHLYGSPQNLINENTPLPHTPPLPQNTPLPHNTPIHPLPHTPLPSRARSIIWRKWFNSRFQF